MHIEEHWSSRETGQQHLICPHLLRRGDDSKAVRVQKAIVMRYQRQVMKECRCRRPRVRVLHALADSCPLVHDLRKKMLQNRARCAYSWS